MEMELLGLKAQVMSPRQVRQLAKKIPPGHYFAALLDSRLLSYEGATKLQGDVLDRNRWSKGYLTALILGCATCRMHKDKPVPHLLIFVNTHDGEEYLPTKDEVATTLLLIKLGNRVPCR